MIHRKATKRKIAFAKKMRRRLTRAEKAFKVIASELQEDYGYKFWPQVVLFGWVVDFWCPKLKLLIEIDGKSHEQSADYDAMRSEVLTEETEATVVRFSNFDCINNPAVVKAQMRQHIRRAIKAIA